MDTRSMYLTPCKTYGGMVQVKVVTDQATTVYTTLTWTTVYTTRYIEIWNEPDSQVEAGGRFWNRTADEFHDLVAHTITALKAYVGCHTAAQQPTITPAQHHAITAPNAKGGTP